jgi:hypothetical protein
MMHSDHLTKVYVGSVVFKMSIFYRCGVEEREIRI